MVLFYSSQHVWPKKQIYIMNDFFQFYCFRSNMVWYENSQQTVTTIICHMGSRDSDVFNCLWCIMSQTMALMHLLKTAKVDGVSCQSASLSRTVTQLCLTLAILSNSLSLQLCLLLYTIAWALVEDWLTHSPCVSVPPLKLLLRSAVCLRSLIHSKFCNLQLQLFCAYYCKVVCST